MKVRINGIDLGYGGTYCEIKYIQIINQPYPAQRSANEGPNNFENFKVGVELATKVFLNTESFGPTVLASAGYSYQRFYKLNKNLDLFHFSLSMGL